MCMQDMLLVVTNFLRFFLLCFRAKEVGDWAVPGNEYIIQILVFLPERELQP
jgi:hypothetical protein